MFSFGEFTYKTSDGKANFSVWELLLFTALGALGGLAGALFNHLNKRLTQWRMRHCASKALRALEAWAVCVVCSTVMYVVPCLWFVAASHLKRVEGVDGACERARPHCRLSLIHISEPTRPY